MDKHEYSEQYYVYPDSPIYCKEQPFIKCKDADCNNKEKIKEVVRCEHCKGWRWQFVTKNNLDIGEWFASASEADDANGKDIERHALKQYNTLRINNTHTAMHLKFKHMKEIAASEKNQTIIHQTRIRWLFPPTNCYFIIPKIRIKSSKQTCTF